MRMFLLASFLLLTSAGAFGQDEEAADPTDPQALLTWADQLGWPDFAAAPFVRVATGQFNQMARKPQNTFVHGFLQSDDGTRFTILPLGNPVEGWFRPGHEFQRSEEGAAPHARIGFEALELEDVAETLVASFPRAIPRWHEDPKGIRWTPTGVLMFAKALEATGRRDLALKLVRSARFDRDGTKNLDEAARAELAHNTLWANVKAFGTPHVSLVELRDRFRHYLEVFGENPRARAGLEILETMVAEQAAHDQAVRPVEAMTEEERIAELVFQLRTQHGQQWSQPGSCSIWVDERDEESPAHQLAAIGYAAVPALIDVVDDPRFSRSVGFWRDFTFSHYVLRVGDVANDILNVITGADFYHSDTTWGAMVKDGQATAVKQSWRRWWAEFQAKGERQFLIDSVTETGNVEHAGRLLAKYPDVAPAVILKAARSIQDVGPRTGLVDHVGKLEGKEAERLLVEELTEGPELITRLEAARILHDRGRPEAIDAMIAEWRRLRKPTYGRDALMEFLTSSGQPRAIAALGEDLDTRTPPERIQMIRTFADRPTSHSDAVESLIVERLTDTDRWEGCSMGFGQSQFQNPRVCDIAAFSLHQMWPDKYGAFNPDETPRQRARCCLRAANAWRAEQGLEALPLPPSEAPTPLPADVADALLSAVLEAEVPEARSAALESLAAHGLPALPCVRDALKEERLAEIRPALLALEKRLASIVSAITYDPPGQVGEHALRSYVEGLRGRSLRADDFVGILIRFCEDMPPEVRGLRLGLDRESDASGVLLALQWLRGDVDLDAPERGWSYSFYVRAGREPLTGGSGGASYEHKQEAAGWTDYRDALADALDSDPGTPIEGYVSIRFTPE